MKEFLPPVMLGIVFMGAIAAIHSTAAPYIGTGGSILLRDVYWRYIKKQQAGHTEQIWVNRLLATFLTAAALTVGLTSTAALVILGALATAFGFVMYVLLVGVIWGFRFPRIGAALGVTFGMVAVWVTYRIYPNPLSMHAAFWGVCLSDSVSPTCAVPWVSRIPRKRQNGRPRCDSFWMTSTPLRPRVGNGGMS